MMNNVFVIDAKRTPMGAFNGQFKNLTASTLGSFPIKHLANQHDLPIDEVFMGCVIQAGLGQSTARQAAMQAGLPESTPCTTFNKVCGSSMQAIISAVDALSSQRLNCIIAGGQESMSNAPYLLENARSGYRIGHQTVIDSLYRDGLEDSLSKNEQGEPNIMGVFAEHVAQKYNLSRSEQEAYAIKTYENYQTNKPLIEQEIIPVSYADKKNNTFSFSSDEPPLKVIPEKFSMLKPAFHKNGTITAATSSSLADGASAILLANEKFIQNHNIQPLAKIIGLTSFAQNSQWFAESPIFAIEKLLKHLSWTTDHVDLFEVNEAFAVVPMAVMKHFNISREKMNIFGGACTLGHPLGSSGARVVVTLINALKQKGLKKGIASVCIGGGEATAIAVEMC